jgi:hypothetical protein
VYYQSVEVLQKHSRSDNIHSEALHQQRASNLLPRELAGRQGHSNVWTFVGSIDLIAVADRQPEVQFKQSGTTFAIMASAFLDLLYSVGSCFACFPSSPNLKINNRSFKILRLLGEVR